MIVLVAFQKQFSITYLWQIPDSIYYNLNGYTGYIPKIYQFRDAGDLYYTVVYAGVVFRNGQGVN